MRLRCVECKKPQRKGQYILVPPDLASSISDEHYCRPVAMCKGCAEKINKDAPIVRPRLPKICGTRTLDAMAQYSPTTGQINPLPLMAIHIDHDLRNDGQLIANVALTHEFVHWWLHRNFDYVTCAQFDNVANRFNNWLYEILDENFPDERFGSIHPWPEKKP